jgi:hypothetical protein
MSRSDKTTVIHSLLRCSKCNLEMMLFGTESESDIRDLYTFACAMCERREVRGVLVRASK